MLKLAFVGPKYLKDRTPYFQIEVSGESNVPPSMPIFSKYVALQSLLAMKMVVRGLSGEDISEENGVKICQLIIDSNLPEEPTQYDIALQTKIRLDMESQNKRKGAGRN